MSKRQPTAAALGHWTQRAERGETFTYGYAAGRMRPLADTMAAARQLCDAGLVALVQRREPGGALAYVAQRTWRKDGR